MCAIVGFKNEQEFVINLSNYFTKLQHRGLDSFGAILIKEKETEGLKSLKQKSFIKDFKKEKDVLYTIAHQRKASIGGVNVKLAHPIFKDNIYTIHNGTKRDLKDILSSIADSDTEAIGEILKHKFVANNVTKTLFEGAGVIFSINTENQSLFVHVDGKRSLFIREDRKIFASEPITKGKWLLVKEQHKIYNSVNDFLQNTEVHENSIDIKNIRELKEERCIVCNMTHFHKKDDDVCCKCKILDKKPIIKTYYRNSIDSNTWGYYDEDKPFVKTQLVEVLTAEGLFFCGEIIDIRKLNNVKFYTVTNENNIEEVTEDCLIPVTSAFLEIGKTYEFSDNGNLWVDGKLEGVINNATYKYQKKIRYGTIGNISTASYKFIREVR